jgi:hypothetical protein
MPINFPIPSFVGELYTFGQTTWEWSGEYWGVYSAQTGYVYSVTTSTGLSGDTTQGNITLLNTAPDQIVTISGGTGILTGGTYPNFTITNTAPDQLVTLSNGQYITISGTYPNFTIATTGITDNDKFTTGFTYNNNTFTLIDNSGNTLSATINDVTGLTINGDLTVTGSSFLNTITANTITNVDYIDFDITQTGTTSSPGRLFWDVNNRTLSVGMLSGVTQQIGEEQYYLVENQTTGTLLDGYVVRAVGTTGSSGKILIDYTIANGTIPAFTTLGVLTQTLLSGETGYVTSFGLVRNIDTTGAPYGETWSQGDILYVSPTILGGFTNVKPIVPNQDIIIAIVMELGVNGSIFVRPDVYRPFKDPQLLTVAKQNADFTSIKDAVDSIVGSSISNRYVITVGPGIFVEDEIDLTTTPYVSIVGSNIQTTLVVPSGSTQHVFKIGINNEISFLSISGASTGYAGIYCYDVGDFAQAHKISMYDCDTNVWVESDTQDTKFYGEYMDFNGTYTYGTRVVGNNGFLALANMENYFNFPTGSNITYCNHATGSGATINAFVCDNVSNGVSGTTAFLIQDGSQLNTSTVTCDGNTYGVRNPNIGSPVRFDIDNASFVDGEWDLYVESIGTFGTLGGSSNHQKIFTASENVYWAFLDIDDGEFDITRKASVTFTDGSHTDFTTLIFEGGTMGLISGGSITTISGFTVQADAGFGYLEKSDDSGIVRRIDWVNNQITLSANTDNYIYINENSNLVSSGTKPITSYNILLGRVITDSTGVEFIDLSPMKAQHTSNSFDSLFTEALGPIYSEGSIVTEGVTPFTIDVTQGDYHFSTNEFLPSGGTNINFIQYYRNGTGSTWVTSATTLVNNTQYDNNGTLTGLTAGYFTKHTLYTVGQGSYENYFLVIGQNEYTTLVEAEDALLPTPPTYFSDGVVQIANIYIEQGSSGITQVEDVRPTIGFRAGGVNASSVHGNLLGLAADDHIQYLLVSGARAMSGNLDMGTNDITNVGTVDGVTVSAHATRHQFGGLDPVGSVTPSANAIPYADVNGTLNDWVSTASTTTFGKVKTSSSSTTVVSDNDSRFLNSFTGGSYSNGTISFTNNSGGTYNVTGFFTGGTDVFVTGGTYSNGSATFTNNTGGTFNVTGFYTGQTSYVNSLTTGTGLSANTTTGNITIVNTSPDQTVVLNNGTGISTSGTYPNFTITNTAPDQTVTISGGTGILTGGTYPNFTITNTAPDQTVVLNNGTGISVTGTYPSFTISSTGSTGETFTGGTVTGNTVFTQGLTATTISATTYQNLPTDIRVTGGTYNNSTGTATFTNNTGGTFNVSGFITGGTSGVSGDYLPLSGGTVTGNTVFTQGLTGNTISGTSIFVDTIDSFNRILRESNGETRVVWGDGQLYNSSILKLDWNNGYLNDSSGVLSVDWENMQLFDTVTPIISVDWRTRNLIDAGGNIKLDWQTGVLSGMTNVQSTTISATTYQNLPTDIRVTGGTYDNLTGSATFTNNTGGTFNVTGFSTGGGGTFTGGTVTGSTDFTNGLTANTISATTYLNIPYITGNTISVQARRTTLYTLTNTFTNITFNVTDIENDSSVISHDNVNTGRIYMYESGLYEIHYHGDVGHGTTANDFETRLYLNDLSVINGGSLSGKSSSTDRITFASNTVFSASSGDYITLQARFPALTSGSIGNLVLSVKQLKGLKGDIGAIGPQGPQGTGLFTGGTISSPTEFTNGLTANTISATTYQNLPILSMKSDTVAAGSFTGNPKKYTVTFTTAYPNTNYTISITGSDNRTFTYESKATTGFVINTNANTVLTGNVDWQTIAIGES